MWLSEGFLGREITLDYPRASNNSKGICKREARDQKSSKSYDNGSRVYLRVEYKKGVMSREYKNPLEAEKDKEEDSPPQRLQKEPNRLTPWF